jgi:hypothetical protein
MRVTEKAAAIFILALSTWMVIMWAATSFQGYEANRMLRLELGSDAASLNQAVRGAATDGVAHNIQMVVRNTYIDYVLILLYWLTFVSLAVLAGRMGERVLAVCAAILISGAALNDMLENGAILTAMRLKPFTDAVAVDISEFAQWKWTLFFLASVMLGLAVALNRRVSTIRRASGGLFIASGVFGLLGIMRYRVSLEYSLWMIDIGVLVFAGALALTLWKIYHSLKVHNRVEHLDRIHVHA